MGAGGWVGHAGENGVRTGAETGRGEGLEVR